MTTLAQVGNLCYAGYASSRSRENIISAVASLLTIPHNIRMDEDEYADAIGKHVVEHVGPVTNVFHEVNPNIVHVDVLVVGPHEERPYHTLVTCGMSERPMRVPIEGPEDLGLIPELRYAELMLCLPPDWSLDPATFTDESNYWPIRWLKRLARLPHQHGSWLSIGHTIPNGDPPHPLRESAPLAVGSSTSQSCSPRNFKNFEWVIERSIFTASSRCLKKR